MSYAGLPEGAQVATPEDLVAKYFPDEAAPTMLRVSKAESGGDPTATNTNDNGTQDHGLFQINDTNIPALRKAGIISSKQDLYDPDKNAQAAAFLYKQSGLQPWSSSKHNKSMTGWGDTEGGTKSDNVHLEYAGIPEGAVANETDFAGLPEGAKVNESASHGATGTWEDTPRFEQAGRDFESAMYRIADRLNPFSPSKPEDKNLFTSVAGGLQALAKGITGYAAAGAYAMIGPDPLMGPEDLDWVAINKNRKALIEKGNMDAGTQFGRDINTAAAIPFTLAGALYDDLKAASYGEDPKTGEPVESQGSAFLECMVNGAMTVGIVHGTIAASDKLSSSQKLMMRVAKDKLDKGDVAGATETINKAVSPTDPVVQDLKDELNKLYQSKDSGNPVKDLQDTVVEAAGEKPLPTREQRQAFIDKQEGVQTGGATPEDVAAMQEREKTQRFQETMKQAAEARDKDMIKFADELAGASPDINMVEKLKGELEDLSKANDMAGRFIKQKEMEALWEELTDAEKAQYPLLAEQLKRSLRAKEAWGKKKEGENAKEVRSDKGQPAETGKVGEGSKKDSGGDVQQGAGATPEASHGETPPKVEEPKVVADRSEPEQPAKVEPPKVAGKAKTPKIEDMGTHTTNEISSKFGDPKPIEEARRALDKAIAANDVKGAEEAVKRLEAANKVFRQTHKKIVLGMLERGEFVSDKVLKDMGLKSSVAPSGGVRETPEFPKDKSKEETELAIASERAQQMQHGLLQGIRDSGNAHNMIGNILNFLKKFPDPRDAETSIPANLKVLEFYKNFLPKVMKDLALRVDEEGNIVSKTGAAHYNPNTGEIVFKKSAYEITTVSKMLEDITHEVTHSISFNALEHDAIYRKEIENLMVSVMDRMSKEQKGRFSEYTKGNKDIKFTPGERAAFYGFTDAHEFVSEVFSNPDVLKYYNDLVGGKASKQTIISHFIKTFSDLLSKTVERLTGRVIGSDVLSQVVNSTLNAVEERQFRAGLLVSNKEQLMDWGFTGTKINANTMKFESPSFPGREFYSTASTPEGISNPEAAWKEAVKWMNSNKDIDFGTIGTKETQSSIARSYQELKDHIGSHLFGGMDTKSLLLAAKIGEGLLKQGFSTFENWTKQFKTGLTPETVKVFEPHLKDIYQQAKAGMSASAKGSSVVTFTKKQLKDAPEFKTDEMVQAEGNTSFDTIANRTELKKKIQDSDLTAKAYRPVDELDHPTYQDTDLGDKVVFIRDASDKFISKYLSNNSQMSRFHTDLHTPVNDAYIKVGDMLANNFLNKRYLGVLLKDLPSAYDKLKGATEHLWDEWNTHHETLKKNGWTEELDALADVKNRTEKVAKKAKDLADKLTKEGADPARIQKALDKYKQALPEATVARDAYNNHPAKDILGRLAKIKEEAEAAQLKLAETEPSIRIALDAEGKLPDNLKAKMTPAEIKKSLSMKMYFEKMNTRLLGYGIDTLGADYVPHMFDPFSKMDRTSPLRFSYYELSAKYPHRAIDFNWMPDAHEVMKSYVENAELRVMRQSVLNKWNDDVIRRISDMSPRYGHFLKDWRDSNFTSEPKSIGRTIANTMIVGEYVKDISLSPSVGFKHGMKTFMTLARQGVIEGVASLVDNMITKPGDFLNKMGVKNDASVNLHLARAFGVSSKEIVAMLSQDTAINRKWADTAQRMLSQPVATIEAWENGVTLTSEAIHGMNKGIPVDTIRREMVNSYLRTNFRSGFDQPISMKLAPVKLLTMFKQTPLKITENIISNIYRAAEGNPAAAVRLVKDPATGILQPSYTRGSRMELARWVAFAGAAEMLARSQDKSILDMFIHVPFITEMLEATRHGWNVKPENFKRIFGQNPVYGTIGVAGEHASKYAQGKERLGDWKVLIGQDKKSALGEVWNISGGQAKKYMRAAYGQVPKGYAGPVEYLLGLKELEK